MKKIPFNAIAPISLIVMALTGLIYLLGCGQSESAKPNATAASQDLETIAVQTAPVQQREIALPVHAAGILTSAAEQRLSFKIGGVISKIYVDEGDVVRPGQLLAVLDKTEIDAQVNQTQQGLGKAERDLARVQGLYRDSSATLELLENATTARDLAKENVRIATFNQQYAEIRATRGGKIIKKLMNEGEVTGPGTPVLVLFETGANDWVVKISVSDRDWARLNTGMKAVVQLDAYPESNFVGKVRELAPAADPANGLYPVEIALQPNGKRFAPGLFAQVDITPEQKRRYTVVPVEAVMEGDGRSAFVFVLEPDGRKVRKTPIQIGFIEGASVIVSSGLEQASEVITSGAPYLTEKSIVKKM